MLSNHFLEGLGSNEETRRCVLTGGHSFSFDEEDIGKLRTLGMEVMMVCRFRDLGCGPEDRGREEAPYVGRWMLVESWILERPDVKKSEYSALLDCISGTFQMAA